MTTTYSAMVVGMGKRGKHHAAAFDRSDRFEVTGICDIDEGRLSEAAGMLEADPKTSTDAAAMAAELKPDVFCFCTMPHLREDFIRIGIDNGAKMIAFEKPLATCSQKAMAIRDMLAGTGVKTVVSHQHRYGVHYRKVKEIVDSGILGRTQMIYASTPGWMLHMMSHMLDYMRWYNAQSEAEWVVGQAAGRGKLADNHPSPDYLAGLIQFANGVRGIIETGAGAPDQPEVAKWWGKNRVCVQGTEGFAEVLTNGGWRAVTGEGVQQGEGIMNYDHDMPPYVQQMAEWLDDDARVHPCCFESAYKGFEILAAVARSAVDGGQVALPLEDGRDEIAELREAVPDRPVILGAPVHAEEFH